MRLGSDAAPVAERTLSAEKTDHCWVVFVDEGEPADGSPSCSALVIVANEASGSTTVYEVNPVRGR